MASNREARMAAARILGIPFNDEDRVTSLADCRIALCVARGVDLVDTHPAQGWDLSERAYRSARESWARFIAESKSTHYRPQWVKARDDWQQHRPDLISDWPEWPEDEESEADAPGLIAA